MKKSQHFACRISLALFLFSLICTPNIASAESIETMCNPENGNLIADISYEFFDKRWKFTDWESAKKELKKTCKSWIGKKQDIATLIDLTEKIEKYRLLSLEIRKKMVSATIERMGEPRNQEKMGLCYANAGADLVSYHVKQRVSVMSAAVRGFQQMGGEEAFLKGWENRDGRYNLGLSIDTTVKGLISGTLCPDDQGKVQLRFNEENIKTLLSQYQNEFRPYFGPKAPTAILKNIETQLQRIFPGLPSKDFLQYINSKNPLDTAIGEWMDRNCKIKFPRKKITMFKKNFSKGLDAAIQKGEITIVGYSTDVFGGNGGGHANLVLGKVIVDGKAHYLLRNTWGATCYQYKESYKLRCDRGHFWLSEDEVNSSFFVAVFFQ